MTAWLTRQAYHTCRFYPKRWTFVEHNIYDSSAHFFGYCIAPSSHQVTFKSDTLHSCASSWIVIDVSKECTWWVTGSICPPKPFTSRPPQGGVVTPTARSAWRLPVVKRASCLLGPRDGCRVLKARLIQTEELVPPMSQDTPVSSGMAWIYLFQPALPPQEMHTCRA